VAGCCECGDEPSGSCATELVSGARKFSVCASDMREKKVKNTGLVCRVFKNQRQRWLDWKSQALRTVAIRVNSIT
jgi:hypothetical protein